MCIGLKLAFFLSAPLKRVSMKSNFICAAARGKPFLAKVRTTSPKRNWIAAVASFVFARTACWSFISSLTTPGIMWSPQKSRRNRLTLLARCWRQCEDPWSLLKTCREGNWPLWKFQFILSTRPLAVMFVVKSGLCRQLVVETFVPTA